MTTDFIFTNHGSITTLAPITPEARAWVDDNLSGDVQHFGQSIVIEPRYAGDIIDAIVWDGLAIN